MDLVTLTKRFVISNLLTVYYSVLTLISFGVTILKNPFKSQWNIKVNLIPPAQMKDPKYGTHKYIKANNITLHYVESGDASKPLMLFLHGFPEFWYSWRHQIVHFNKDYRCVAVDMRGYGDSERPEGVSSYKLDHIVEDIKDLIGKLGAEKCIVVGHDWGGLVACRLRDKYPDVLSACISLAGVSIESLYENIWNSDVQKKMSGYVFSFHAPILPELALRKNDLEIFDRIMGDNIEKEDIECFKYWFRKEYAYTPPLNYYRANHIINCSQQNRHKEPVPFLVALAENDKYIHTQTLNIMARSYEHIETAIVKGCGHFIQQEIPERVNKLVADFLKSHKI